VIGLAIAIAFLVQGAADQGQLRVTPGAEPETKTIYRALKQGEQRVEGLLRRIECPPGRPVTFVLNLADNKPARYSAPSLQSVDFIAHTADFRGPVSCGGKTPPERVYLTWASSGRTTRVVAVEFLPGKERR
jgi:hypothetical protein